MHVSAEASGILPTRGYNDGNSMSRGMPAAMTSAYVLALDTAHQQCSASLLSRDGSVSVLRSETVGNKHAERILSLIDELLDEAGLTKADLGLVAFGEGPGSFTGLRVACGVAQGIAWALRTNVAAVCNLEADAQATADAADLPAGTRIAVMNDARMQEAYCGLYETAGRGVRVKVLCEPLLVKPEAIGGWLADCRADAVCGSALSVYAAEISLPEGLRTADIPADMIVTLARLAFDDEDAGRTMLPALASPLYVRNRVALTMAERARGERL